MISSVMQLPTLILPMPLVTHRRKAHFHHHMMHLLSLILRMEVWITCFLSLNHCFHRITAHGLYMYDRPAWTGHVYKTECFFPTWINKESAPHVQALVDAYHNLWGTERIGADEKAMSTRTGRPLTDKWTFSTNGVSIQGRYGIPCVGFGPGAESQAHAPNEITWKQDLVTCAALYAAVPGLYKPENKDGSATSFRQELTGNDIK